MLLLRGDCEEGPCREFLIGRDCSFDGGTGGSSGSEVVEFSLNGPSGPRALSMASKRVDCAPIFRGVLGPLVIEDREVKDTEGESVCNCLAILSGSRVR